MASNAEPRLNLHFINLISKLFHDSIQIKNFNFWSKAGRLMGLTWKEEYLDIVLVPIGLFIMFGYHLFLIYRFLKHPHTTVIGYDHHNKRAWVDRMIQVQNIYPIEQKKKKTWSLIENNLTTLMNKL